MQNPTCLLSGRKLRTLERKKKKNNAIKSGHYVYACSPRAAHALNLQATTLPYSGEPSVSDHNYFSVQIVSLPGDHQLGDKNCQGTHCPQPGVKVLYNGSSKGKAYLQKSGTQD